MSFSHGFIAHDKRVEASKTTHNPTSIRNAWTIFSP